MAPSSRFAISCTRLFARGVHGSYARRGSPRSFLFTGPALALLCFSASGAHAAQPFHPAPAVHGSVNTRPPGYLGIEFHDLSDDQLRPLRLSAGRGVEVMMVDHDGPAGKAGLRAHDIIVSLNGQALAGAEALRRMIHDAGAGMQVALTIFRAGHPLTVNAQLANRDEVERAAAVHLARNEPPPALALAAADDPAETTAVADRSVAEPSPSASAANVAGSMAPATPPPGSGFLGHIVHGSIYTGAVLDTMEPQLAGFFGAPQGVGLLIHSVLPGSPAATAGLRAGDVIVRADLYTLHNSSDWTKRLHTAKGRPITLSILRDRRELTLTLQQDLKHHSLVEWPVELGTSKD